MCLSHSSRAANGAPWKFTGCIETPCLIFFDGAFVNTNALVCWVNYNASMHNSTDTLPKIISLFFVVH
jgi:hypothetical protein